VAIRVRDGALTLTTMLFGDEVRSATEIAAEIDGAKPTRKQVESAVAVIEELESNGSLTPALNYYRANLPPESWLHPGRELPAVNAPTMGIWSSGDIALTERQMTNSAAGVTGEWRYERIDGPGHWMQLEAPDAVNRLLVDFLPA